METPTSLKRHSTEQTELSEIRKWFPRFWRKMLSLYGRPWESSYGQVDGSGYIEWMQSLGSMTERQVGNGLISLMEEGNEFPPNLIKFLKLCQTSRPVYHEPFKALPQVKRKYSVMRIERAKQNALYGNAFQVIANTDNMIMDWTSEDETDLILLITQWDRDTGLEGLNLLVDNHRFSGSA
jgi:hypothetical protein